MRLCFKPHWFLFTLPRKFLLNNCSGLLKGHTNPSVYHHKTRFVFGALYTLQWQNAKKLRPIYKISNWLRKSWTRYGVEKKLIDWTEVYWNSYFFQRKLDNTVIYDPHTGRFTFRRRIGRLFNMPRLKRNNKGRPTGVSISTFNELKRNCTIVACQKQVFQP